ncbi:MAG TPA: TIR domain-containing protein [Blastocatellia bacterium]|nr:TIR domain-containing protein [Blastocatellia bacterium]
MSSTANFEYDIFISYAHIDNQPLDAGLKGWVETLHERLRVRLAQLLGEEARIWRDLKLQGNDVFADTLTQHIAKAAIMVSIISPRYVKSEWCLRELNEFCRLAEMKAGLKIGDKLRIFKVVKTHIPHEQHPNVLQGSLGYEFYEYDQARNRAKEFSSEIVPARDIRYWEKLDDLAYDIKQLIETLRNSAGLANASALTPVSTSAATIYLAETTSDLTEQRDKIKRELQQHGHLVLPDKGLPLVGQAFKQEVTDCLSRSQLSVHLIGEHYGIIPEGEGRSVIELQNELAAIAGDRLQRVIWMPVGLQPQGEPQQRFVNQLRLGLSSQRGTDLLETKLEDLKTVIQEKLTRPEKTQAASATSSNGDVASVYLICDKQDMDSVKPIEDYLFDKGLDVTLPAIEGDETQIIQDHKDNLMMCDAVMIYYGRAGELWLRMKQRELQKVAGYGRTEPLTAKAIYITGPPTDSKERIRDHDALVIKNYEAFSPERLQPFLERVQRARGA